MDKLTSLKTAWEAYFNGMPPQSQIKITQLLHDVQARISLPADETELLLTNYKKVILQYNCMGLSADEILKRLNTSNLGSYYIADALNRWYALDNAAKLQPLAMNANWMSVFRLTAVLNEDVIPEILQMALTYTIKRFPYFAVNIKQGLFWHYLDGVKKYYCIEKDDGIVCKSMDVSQRTSPLFRVLYTDKKISVEFFHVLTDGTGGSIFLKTLIAEYFRLLGVNIPYSKTVLRMDDEPQAEEWANDFHKATRQNKAKGFLDTPALQLDGKLCKPNGHKSIQYVLDTQELKRLAAEYGVSVNTLLLGFLFSACKKATTKTKGNFQIQVPVDMRKYILTKTLKNFSMYCIVKVGAKKELAFRELLIEISKQIKEKTEKNRLIGMMYTSNRIVRLLGYVPSILKNTVTSLGYSIIGDSLFTTTLSNIGKVELPRNLAGRIKQMEFHLGASISNKANCSVVSCNGKTILSVTKTTYLPAFENALLELMNKHNLFLKLEGGTKNETICA